MVLGVSTHAPGAGYNQHGYAPKEDYYKTDNYGGNSSSMQMMRPHSTNHSPSRPNHHGNGSYPHSNGYGNSGYSTGMHSQHGSGTNGYGNSGMHSQHGPGSNGYGNNEMHSQHGPGSNGYGNSGMHSQHGPGSNGYGNNHGSHKGPSRPQETSYGYQSHGHSNSSPYYQQQQNGSHGWISKDLDD